jgi:predicted nuclease of predicted toxin-antitoxin system
MAEKISFYFDEMMRRTAAEELIKRGYQVIMAVDVEMVSKDDPEHLSYAKENRYVLVTLDRKFAGLTSQRTDHAGLICLTIEAQVNIGTVVRLLTDFADQHTPEEVAGHVFWLK